MKWQGKLLRSRQLVVGYSYDATHNSDGPNEWDHTSLAPIGESDIVALQDLHEYDMK